MSQNLQDFKQTVQKTLRGGAQRMHGKVYEFEKFK